MWLEGGGRVAVKEIASILNSYTPTFVGIRYYIMKQISSFDLRGALRFFL